MNVAPRVVIVHRRTEYDELIARHGTRGQAAFFLESRGRSVDELEERHRQTTAAIAQVASAIPLDWRRGTVERADVSRFLFGPDDVVVVVGQDGLVANVAKYLDGQPVVGIDPEPGRNAGALVTHEPAETAELLRATGSAQERTMVQATLDDGQRLLALNEIFVGPQTHQTARYELHPPDSRPEYQASSGVIVSTGTGATGWSRSISLERGSKLPLPQPTERRLVWFVREAWPSPATSISATEGELVDAELVLTMQSDVAVAFGDGIESDSLTLSFGQTLRLRQAPTALRLV